MPSFHQLHSKGSHSSLASQQGISYNNNHDSSSNNNADGTPSIKGAYHNLETPCCDIARATVLKMVQSLNPSYAVGSVSSQDSKKNKINVKSASLPHAASCLTVVAAREMERLAASEAAALVAAVGTKKKKKKKKKKAALPAVNSADTTNDSTPVEELSASELPGLHSPSVVKESHYGMAKVAQSRLKYNTAALNSVCDQESKAKSEGVCAKVIQGKEASVERQHQQPGRAALDILYPASYKNQDFDMLKELFANRSLSDFFHKLSLLECVGTPSSLGPKTTISNRKGSKNKQQRQLPHAHDTPSTAENDVGHKYAFGTLHQVRQHAAAIQCLVCKRNCLGLLAQYSDEVYQAHRTSSSVVENPTEGRVQVEVPLLPSCPSTAEPTLQSQPATNVSSPSTLTVPVLGMTGGVQEQVDQAFSYELLEEGAGADKTKRSTDGGPRRDDKVAQNSALSVPLLLKSNCGKTLPAHVADQSAVYENVSMLLPSAFVDHSKERSKNNNDDKTETSVEKKVGIIEAFNEFFSRSLLPLGHDSSFSLKNEETPEHKSGEGGKDTEKEEDEKAKKPQKDNPFANLKWKKELYSGHLFDNASSDAFCQLEETFDAQHRLAHLDLQLSDIKQKRQAIISSFNQVKNELEGSNGFSSKIRQDVGFRQASQIRGIDTELYGLVEQMTIILIEVTKLAFCSHVTKCASEMQLVDSRPLVEEDKIEREKDKKNGFETSAFLNVNLSRETQQAAKALWITYDTVLWKYTEHAINYRGEQMYGWQSIDKERPNGSGGEAAEFSLLGESKGMHEGRNNDSSSGSMSRMSYIPQLFRSSYLRTKLAHMLECQLDDVNGLFCELEGFFRCHMKDLTCWADHHRRLLPRLPPFEGAEEQLALLRLGLARTISKGTAHEVREEQNEKDFHIRELAFNRIDEISEKERDRVLAAVSGIGSPSCLSQEEVQWIREWKDNFKDEWYDLQMKVMEGTEVSKMDLHFFFGLEFF
jgi:hypothetical protein